VHVCVVLAAGADGLGACACGVPELLALLARLHTEGRVGDRGRRLVRLFPEPRNHFAPGGVCASITPQCPCRYGVVKQSYMQCLCGLPVMFPAVVIAPLRLVSFALSRATGSAQTLLSGFEPVKRLPPHQLSSNPSQCDWRLRQGHDP
jgi:hypothetical protein